MSTFLRVDWIVGGPAGHARCWGLGPWNHDRWHGRNREGYVLLVPESVPLRAYGLRHSGGAGRARKLKLGRVRDAVCETQFSDLLAEVRDGRWRVGERVNTTPAAEVVQLIERAVVAFRGL